MRKEVLKLEANPDDSKELNGPHEEEVHFVNSKRENVEEAAESLSLLEGSSNVEIIETLANNYKEELDSVSKAIILNLAQYLWENFIDLNDFLKHITKTKTIRNNKGANNIIVVDSKDLFAKLREVDALTCERREDDVYGNLEQVLAISKYPSMLSVKKLKKVVEDVSMDQLEVEFAKETNPPAIKSEASNIEKFVKEEKEKGEKYKTDADVKNEEENKVEDFNDEEINDQQLEQLHGKLISVESDARHEEDPKANSLGNPVQPQYDGNEFSNYIADYLHQEDSKEIIPHPANGGAKDFEEIRDLEKNNEEKKDANDKRPQTVSEYEDDFVADKDDSLEKHRGMLLNNKSRGSSASRRE